MIILVDQVPQLPLLHDLEEPDAIVIEGRSSASEGPRFRDDPAELLEGLGGVSMVHLESSAVPSDQAHRHAGDRPPWSNSRTSKHDRPSEAKWIQTSSLGVTNTGGRSPGTSRTSTC